VAACGAAQDRVLVTQREGGAHVMLDSLNHLPRGRVVDHEFPPATPRPRAWRYFGSP
jgi:hypothetical protein